MSEVERDKLLECRPEVLKFAILMEETLRKHDAYKGHDGWKDGAESQALVTSAATHAISALAACRVGDCTAHRDEAADVANYLMMSLDVAGVL